MASVRGDLTATADSFGRVVLTSAISGVTFDIEHFHLTASEPFSGTKHVCGIVGELTGARELTVRLFVRNSTNNTLELASNTQVSFEYELFDS